MCLGTVKMLSPAKYCFALLSAILRRLNLKYSIRERDRRLNNIGKVDRKSKLSECITYLYNEKQLKASGFLCWSTIQIDKEDFAPKTSFLGA